MPLPSSSSPVVFLSSITSDIGIALAKRYSRDGYIVTGTYRSTALLPELKELPRCHIFYCDLADVDLIKKSTEQFAALGLKWDTFVSLASWPPPLTPFFGGDFEQWSASVHVNAIEQFRVLHALHPYRNRAIVANAVFFAGPGTNNAVKNFSALTISKLMLIKMCELLDAEDETLNTFIIGPGWTRTKTHDLILSDPGVSEEKKRDTLNFLASGGGTSMDDIYSSIQWFCANGRSVAGGRNFSIVNDRWGTEEMAAELRKDPNMYKLRRFRNDWSNRNKSL